MTPQSMTASSFTPQQKAVLFGLLAQSISAHFPGQAAILLRKAVEAYGMERGQRMAARCLQNGDALDMIAYDAYGDLQHFAGLLVHSHNGRFTKNDALSFRKNYHIGGTQIDAQVPSKF